MKKTISLLLSIIIILSSFSFLIIPISADDWPWPALDKNKITSKGRIIETDGGYSGSDAVKYAQTFATSYNQYYYPYSEADCANFVSQCLLYGGLSRSDCWEPPSGERRNDSSFSWRLVDYLFFYLTGDNTGNDNRSLDKHCNYPYLDSEKLRANLKALSSNTQGIEYVKSKANEYIDYANQTSELNIDISNITGNTVEKYIENVIEAIDRSIVYNIGPGDVIIGEDIKQDKYGHVMIVSSKYISCINSNGKLSYNIYYCGHTNDRKDSTLGAKHINAYVFMSSGERSPNEYTIQFDPNGGSDVPDTLYGYGYDDSAEMGDIDSEMPYREGYDFMGWSASPNNSTNYCIAYQTITSNPDAVQTRGDWTYYDYCKYTGGDPSNHTLTLYAKWKRSTQTYRIIFNANGGSGVPDTIYAEGENSGVIMGDIGSIIPDKQGYDFMGWSASPNTTDYNYCIKYLAEKGPNPNAIETLPNWTYYDYCFATNGDPSNPTLTLYAIWEYNPSTYNYYNTNIYTIEFDANGGSGVPDTICVEGEDIYVEMGDIGSTIPYRSGYNFMGWSASPYNSTCDCIAYLRYETFNPDAEQTCEGWSYYDYCNYSEGDTSNPTLTLYAIWEEEQAWGDAYEEDDEYYDDEYYDDEYYDNEYYDNEYYDNECDNDTWCDSAYGSYCEFIYTVECDGYYNFYTGQDEDYLNPILEIYDCQANFAGSGYDYYYAGTYYIIVYDSNWNEGTMYLYVDYEEQPDENCDDDESNNDWYYYDGYDYYEYGDDEYDYDENEDENDTIFWEEFTAEYSGWYCVYTCHDEDYLDPVFKIYDDCYNYIDGSDDSDIVDNNDGYTEVFFDEGCTYLFRVWDYHNNEGNIYIYADYMY